MNFAMAHKNYITKAELKGYDFDNVWNADLYDMVNRKDENGYNGRYFSSWYLDMRHEGESRRAITDMIWFLTISYFKANYPGFKTGRMAQTNLSKVTGYIAEKMNVWGGEIIRWMKGMEFGKEYDMDVCDKWGLDTITIYINK